MLLSIQEFFGGLTGYERFLWILAIPASILLLGVIIKSLTVGVKSILEMEGKFELFTFRNFLYFLTTWVWSGLYFLDIGMSEKVSWIDGDDYCCNLVLFQKPEISIRDSQKGGFSKNLYKT